jgi:hypothetical protein
LPPGIVRKSHQSFLLNVASSASTLNSSTPSAGFHDSPTYDMDRGG